MSIFDYTKQAEGKSATVTLLVKVAGAGTLSLSQVGPKDQLRFLGPLGNGFQVGDFKRSLLVAGGVGISGLYSLAKSLTARGRPPLFVLGVNSCEESPVRLAMTEVTPLHRWALPETIEPLRLVVSLLFDIFVPSMVASLYPGDQGAFCGTACDLVERLLGANPAYAGDTALVACGPAAMLSGLADIARHHGVKQYLVLLEERMACGVGTCLGCAVGLRSTADQSSQEPFCYKRVCVDGPVFDGYRVVWRKG